ncbi:O-methyltransferase [Sphingomonas sp. NFR15]|uniref:O-methyltransferase n=1 Tax=Sphingomonas sp. NFR15 TaxID=1566282 RepID=UPI000B851764|nr:class I SAM-dependent methyltransferase [Sphingomonas sp. NFR15]
MTTLTKAPVAPLLATLFASAERSEGMLPPALANLSVAERGAMLRSKADYLELYSRMKDSPLAVSRETGRLLYMLARALGAKAIVEFGTSFGISTLHLAAALRDNGGGRLITTEFEPAKIARATENLGAGGVLDLIDLRAGDALHTLAHDLPETIDLVLLDGAKALYGDILDLLESRLRPGALLIADNADMCPEYLTRVRDAGRGYLSVPFADDVEVSMRIG